MNELSSQKWGLCGKNQKKKKSRFWLWLTQLVRPVQCWFGVRRFSVCQLNRWSRPTVHLVPVTFVAVQIHFRLKIDEMDCPRPMFHNVQGYPVNSPASSILFRYAWPLYQQLLSKSPPPPPPPIRITKPLIQHS